MFIQSIHVCIYYFISDLSFNNIEVIEGLSKLSKLEDLTLYNNRIQTVENMDSLLQLHVFSIGNNDIHDLENVCISNKINSKLIKRRSKVPSLLSFTVLQF